MEKSLAPLTWMRQLVRPAKRWLAACLRVLPFSSETFGPPKGVVANTPEWIEGRAAMGLGDQAHCWTVTPPRLIHRKLPTMANNQNCEFLHRLVDQTHTAGLVMKISGARVSNLCVLSPDDRVYQDLSLHRDLHIEELQWILSTIKLPRPEPVKGNLVLLGESFAGTYYHWLFIALGRLAHIRKRFPIDKIDFFSVSHLNESFHRDTLRMLGIEDKRILSFKDHPHVKPDAVVLSNWTGGFDPTVAEFLRDAFLPHASSPKPNSPKRIYVSRARCGRRHIANEDEFHSAVRQAGFETVFTEGMSFADQMALFRDAEAVIGPHGAGFANLVFCRPGTKVIELFNEGWRPEIFWQLAESGGLDHYCLLGSDVSPVLTDQRPQDRNFHVDIQKLKDLLKKANLN